MQTWFEKYADSREPDQKIGPPDDPYMLRWHVTPRDNEAGGIYLHYFRHSDDDRALHDHPWDSVSIVLSGEYIEHLPGGCTRHIKAGDVIARSAEFTHRIEVIERGFTLFTKGPKTREWGFHCPEGFRHWTRFANPENGGEIGMGCGEYGDPVTEATPLF